MKAIVRDRYGPAEVLALDEVAPPEPGSNEVLVRVRAASVNPADWHMMTAVPYLVRLESGLRRPKRRGLGADLAGMVERIGDGVTAFAPGDEVFGEGAGAYAELALVSEKALARKPPNVTFEQAAAVPIAGLTALQGLRDKGRLVAGQRVLVNGASGGVGTFAVQIAKAIGAEVTGVCSTRNVAMVRDLGADRVVDYTNEDFTQTGSRYDVILDNVGLRPLGEVRRVLAADGTYVLVSGPMHRIWGPLPKLAGALVLSLFSRQRLVGLLARAHGRDLAYLADLMEQGRLVPVVERTFDLAQVPEALRLQGEGHARGKTVITVA